MGTSETGSTGTASSTATVLDDTDLENPNEGVVEGEHPEKDWSEKTGEAFAAAIVTACALFMVKFAGAMVSGLIAWSKDKFFPPVAIKTKIDANTPPESVPPNATGVVEFRGHDGIYEMEWDVLVR
jgi:hypothetical protein